jgi:hypothetical protein
MGEWRFGVTLVPRDEASEERERQRTVEAIVRARQDRGWELVRVTERDDSELFVFRQPA